MEMFRIVYRVFSRFNHGKLKGQVNPKEHVDVTIYREAVTGKHGPEAPMNEIKGYIRKEHGDLPSKFLEIERIA